MARVEPPTVHCKEWENSNMKHVPVEKVSNYFFHRKSFWAANSKTITHFFDVVTSLASFQLLAWRTAQGITLNGEPAVRVGWRAVVPIELRNINFWRAAEKGGPADWRAGHEGGRRESENSGSAVYTTERTSGLQKRWTAGQQKRAVCRNKYLKLAKVIVIRHAALAMNGQPQLPCCIARQPASIYAARRPAKT